jgi:hypothetical protein
MLIQTVLQFPETSPEFTLRESMKFLGEHLSPHFVSESSNGYRASKDTNTDVAVFCLSRHGFAEQNRSYRYVVQSLSRNNTIRGQVCFDDIRSAVTASNDLIA